MTERCGRVMVGSGADGYDPTCDLPNGHDPDICRSVAAIDQFNLDPDDPRIATGVDSRSPWQRIADSLLDAPPERRVGCDT